MGKNEKHNKKAGTSSSTIVTHGKSIIRINPAIVYFTHSRVRPFFTGCNKRIEETLEEILSGRTRVDQLPLISVIENDGHYFSLNNRRLYLFKELLKLGILTEVEGVMVYLKPALERERLRYVPERCSLHAKLMKEPAKKDTATVTNISDEVEDQQNDENFETGISEDVYSGSDEVK